jgi:hypothetical protein
LDIGVLTNVVSADLLMKNAISTNVVRRNVVCTKEGWKMLAKPMALSHSIIVTFRQVSYVQTMF